MKAATLTFHTDEDGHTYLDKRELLALIHDCSINEAEHMIENGHDIEINILSADDFRAE